MSLLYNPKSEDSNGDDHILEMGYSIDPFLLVPGYKNRTIRTQTRRRDVHPLHSPFPRSKESLPDLDRRYLSDCIF